MEALGKRENASILTRNADKQYPGAGRLSQKSTILRYSPACRGHRHSSNVRQLGTRRARRSVRSVPPPTLLRLQTIRRRMARRRARALGGAATTKHRQASQRQDRLRDQLHPLLLPAPAPNPAPAPPARNLGRHTLFRAGFRGAAGRNHGRGMNSTL